MSEAESQEGRPLPRGGTPPLRFRELLHRLFSIANQGFVRLEFLQMAGGAILECLGGDVLEVRVEEAGRVYRCRATVGEGVSRFICQGPGPLELAGAGTPAPPGLPDQILESVMRGQLAAASPFSTRGGSFWTGDATRPVLLRDSGRHDAAARSLVIGGDCLSLAFVPVPVDERLRGVLHLGRRKADAFTRDDIQFFETVGEILGVAVAFQAAQWALRERVKELDCLYGIAQVTLRPGLTLEQQLQAIVELLPPGWQYPELTAARITLDGRPFCTPDFSEAAWAQRAELRVDGRLRGLVEVFYSREMPGFAEGPFLQEERSLIDEVARQVGSLVDRWEEQKAQAQLFHMLEQRRE